MIDPSNPNVYGWALALLGSIIVLFLGERFKHYLTREQREIAAEDRDNKITGDALRAQLEGWKQYSEQLTEFNTELSQRLKGMDQRLADRDDHISRQDMRIASCERDRNRLWRRIEQLGGGPIPDDVGSDGC